MVSGVSAKRSHPLSSTHSSTLSSKQTCHHSLVSSPHRCGAGNSLVTKNKLNFFSPKPSRRKRCRAQQTFGKPRSFSDQCSKDIWPSSEFKLTSGQPLHRWKPLTQPQVPWLLSPPSQGTRPLCHPPGALQYSFQDSHPVFQTTQGSSWLIPTTTKNSSAKAPISRCVKPNLTQ